MNILLSEIRSSEVYTHKKVFHEICKPLQHLNINYFDYARFYRDKEVLLLSNDLEYVNSFVNHPIYQTQVPVILPAGIHPWSSYIDNDFLLNASGNFNHYHGVTIVNDKPDYIELFNFSGAIQHRELLSTYNNYFTKLINFKNYFLQELKHKRIEIDNLKLEQPFKPVRNSLSVNNQIYRKEIDDFLGAMAEHHYFIVDNEMVKLTARQVECLEYLKQGYSNKQIARHLRASPRTIEKHCQSLYEKYRVNGRSQLLSKLLSNGG